MLVTSFDATGWRPDVYDGTGVRGEGIAFLKNDARLATADGAGEICTRFTDKKVGRRRTGVHQRRVRLSKVSDSEQRLSIPTLNEMPTQ